MTRDQFVQVFKPVAIQVTSGTGLFPQTALTMGMVESANAKGEIMKGLTVRFKNLFGIKDTKQDYWDGQTVVLQTSNDSKKTNVFRVYDSYADSFKDWVDFIKKNKRYKEHGVFEASNFKEQLLRIAQAGYAEAGAKKYYALLSSVGDKVNEFFVKPSVRKKSDKVLDWALAGIATLLIFSYGDE